MNSRCLLVIAICGLFVGQRQVISANLGPQLLPLPAMAQSANIANIPLKEQAGEIQFLQPSITLTADKDSVQNIDPDAPPVMINRTVEIEIVKKEPGKDPRPIVESKAPIFDKDGNKVGEEITSGRVGSNETSTDKSTTVTIIEGTTKDGAAQIKATYSLLPTIISAITIILLF